MFNLPYLPSEKLLFFFKSLQSGFWSHHSMKVCFFPGHSLTPSYRTQWTPIGPYLPQPLPLPVSDTVGPPALTLPFSWASVTSCRPGLPPISLAWWLQRHLGRSSLLAMSICFLEEITQTCANNSHIHLSFLSLQAPDPCTLLPTEYSHAWRSCVFIWLRWLCPSVEIHCFPLKILAHFLLPVFLCFL